MIEKGMTAVRFLRAALVLAIALPFSARDGHAQAADTARVTTALWTACPGAWLRVATVDEQRVEGRCVRVADDRLALTNRGLESRIALPSVDSLWIRRSYTPQATVLLAAAGGAAGTLLNGRTPEDECIPVYGCGRNEQRARDIIMGTTGALIGAAAGLYLGPRFRGWRLLVP